MNALLRPLILFTALMFAAGTVLQTNTKIPSTSSSTRVSAATYSHTVPATRYFPRWPKAGSVSARRTARAGSTTRRNTLAIFAHPSKRWGTGWRSSIQRDHLFPG